jgi:endonuclease/exonuclease/phosphatase family metal-dependent hydrolase
MGILLVGWGHVRSLVGFQAPVLTEPGAANLRVSTLNCYGLQDRERQNELIDEPRLMAILKGEDPDVFCLQEFPYERRQAGKYITYLVNHSELDHVYQERGGLVIFSRFPLRNKTSVYFENKVNGYQYADVEVKGQTLRLFNVHLQSNSVTNLAEEVAERGNFQERETWMNVGGMISRYKRAAAMRAQQIGEIKQVIAESPHPVILCGDFNDVPQSYVYRRLSEQLKDTFKEKGSGLGMTYSGAIPGLRIDYVFISPQLQTYSHQIDKVGFSDHQQVWSTILLEDEPGNGAARK